MVEDTQTIADAPARQLAYSRVAAAFSRYVISDADRTTAAIEGGAALVDLKRATPHGQFGAVLETLGIRLRTAQDWMRLSGLGVKCATVALLGGIRATLEISRKVGADMLLDVARRMAGGADRQEAIKEAWQAETIARLDKLMRMLAELRAELGPGSPAWRRYSEDFAVDKINDWSRWAA